MQQFDSMSEMCMMEHDRMGNMDILVHYLVFDNIGTCAVKLHP